MKQEDKELLLKDICARLPYSVKVHTPLKPICTIYSKPTIYSTVVIDGAGEKVCYTEDIKPYLFPLSSLTEKQRNEISQLLIDTQNTFSPYGKINTKGCDNLFVCSVKQSNALIKYCLMHHLDINGLIERGLAIDATGLNIY